MVETSCDILIVGAGPAGLAAASELLRLGTGRVILIDSGKSMENRHCSTVDAGQCAMCQQCSLLSGYGGASGILGGKLCFFPAGERLAQHVGYTNGEANYRVNELLRQFGVRIDESLNNNLSLPKQQLEKLTLKKYVASPLSRQKLRCLFSGLLKYIQQGGVSTYSNTQVLHIMPSHTGGWFNVTCDIGGQLCRIKVRNSIVLATGRSGSEWLLNTFEHLNVKAIYDNVDVGIRLEFPNENASELPSMLQDPKLKLYANSNKEIRTLCWCRGGELCTTKVGDSVLVDGHFSDYIRSSTSVSVVARLPVPTGITPMDYATQQYSASVRSLPACQDLWSFLGLHRNRIKASFTQPLPFECQPLDIAGAFSQPVKERISEMIVGLDHLMAGNLLRQRDARVYAPVVDKFWATPELDCNLMTSVPGIYVAGDATGLARGIVQGLFSGAFVAEAIVRNSSLAGCIQLNHLTLTGRQM